MMKRSQLIKNAALGKAGASVFSKLAIADLSKVGQTKKEAPKPKLKVTVPKELPKPKLIRPDSLQSDSLATSKELAQFAKADSLQQVANREQFVQDSTEWGGIIARLRKMTGL